jgi:hypothetical protein
LDDAQLRVLEAALDRLIPPDEPSPGEHSPGAAACGVAGYVDQLLGAFTFDPPRIWTGGPFSGRAGGEAGFDRWLQLGALDELAWRTRIEGSRGIPAREFNGPVRGWQQIYTDGLEALGADFADLGDDEQDARLSAAGELTSVLYLHACEGMYGAPEYGGNRDLSGWRAIGYAGDVQPRGWTDDEVRLP